MREHFAARRISTAAWRCGSGQGTEPTTSSCYVYERKRGIFVEGKLRKH
ncbi:hypothetical protein E2C01_068657 [Portunus trituberculatus]|uniref:Uncharacterized protein n=1 Tax=Portunus trituberculatus TaxID=210409 RepID=A0A5B7HPD5_PORTR|nr:hypothetical protein [Portunus trituberculatus]